MNPTTAAGQAHPASAIPKRQAATTTGVIRNEPLDWLRGLLALSIMFYHLRTWEFSQPDASTLLGRLGIYGVSMFFVLSGLSIAIAYNRFLTDAGSAGRFYLRRVFRIWPLFWITVLSVSAMNLSIGTPVSLKIVVANLTTLFGFLSPTSYMTAGAWSIGNEMVYYSLTPLLLLTYRRSRLAGHLLVAGTVAVGMYFSTVLLSPGMKLPQQWGTYVNPFNNLFLYCLGITLFFIRAPFQHRAQPVLLLLVCAAAFLLYPVAGDAIHLVTGAARIVFCLASVGLVYAAYRMDIALPSWLARPLVQLGLATYGVYLLHPVIWQAVRLLLGRLQWDLHGWPVLVGVSIATVLIAVALFHTMESYFIRLGKRLTSKSDSSTATAAA